MIRSLERLLVSPGGLGMPRRVDSNSWLEKTVFSFLCRFLQFLHGFSVCAHAGFPCTGVGAGLGYEDGGINKGSGERCFSS